MTDIGKAFGGVQALDGVNLEVRHGEIHALLGENGAGKSTLLKILRGVQPPDSGIIEIDGVPLIEHTPEASRAAGIAMIFQEMSLIPTLTVAQNIFLNREIRNHLGLIDDREAVRVARRLIEEFDVDIDPAAQVSELGAGQKQLIEIVKAVSQKTKILVLDEPTSALSSAEVERLFALLKRLRSEGVGIVYVSHRMDEITKIADRATILRDGRHVITAPLSALTLETIVEHIVGRRSRGFSDHSAVMIRQGLPLLELVNVSGARKPRNVTLTVHAGEVVGVAGLLGSGRSALARLVYGLEPVVVGQIRVKGRAIAASTPRTASAAGIALIPEDRLRQGVVIQHSVANNIALSVLGRISRRSWISRVAMDQIVVEQMRRLRIKAEAPETPVQALSGGNQQKVVLGKWLATDPDILILDEPTAGIDIGSKAEIIVLIRELASQGKGVLLISSELPELLAASDRIIVMANGRTIREFGRRDLDPDDAVTTDAAERLQRAEQRLQIAIQEASANG
ncbi:MAG TPA: sugar ABC transporter ATP-binding protein [Magnetospirillaceae bacterium]|jgi:ribose transport system ATP-binding protein